MSRARAMLVMILALGLAGCVGPSSIVGPTKPAPTIDLQECRLSSPGMEESLVARCGTLAVPEDRDNSEGRQIDLYIALVPAVSRNPKPDPLFLLAGGPGQAATEAYPTVIAAAFRRVHQDRDILLVDQRGTGKSHPLQCDLPEEGEADDGGTSEADASDATASAATTIAALQACAAVLDADLRQYTTDAAVRDLDQVRAALGYDRINLYGASYGTRLALAYLHRYPGRTRAVILDAVVSADFSIYGTAGRDGARALELLFDRCQADLACQGAFPDLRSEFGALLTRLAEKPETVRVAHPRNGKPIEFDLTRERFAGMVFALLYTPELSALLPLSIHTAFADGNYAPLVAQALASDAGLYRGLLYAVVCTEDAPFIPPDKAAAINEGTYFGDMSRTMRQVCEGWPRGPLPPDFRMEVSSDVPVLLLSGEADPITPPQYAEQAAQSLPNSLHLVGPGMGHGMAMRGCVPNVVASFLEAASVQGLDGACVQQIAPPPFFVRWTGSEP